MKESLNGPQEMIAATPEFPFYLRNDEQRGGDVIIHGLEKEQNKLRKKDLLIVSASPRQR